MPSGRSTSYLLFFEIFTGRCTGKSTLFETAAIRGGPPWPYLHDFYTGRSTLTSLSAEGRGVYLLPGGPAHFLFEAAFEHKIGDPKWTSRYDNDDGGPACMSTHGGPSCMRHVDGGPACIETRLVDFPVYAEYGGPPCMDELLDLLSSLLGVSERDPLRSRPLAILPSHDQP